MTKVIVVPTPDTSWGLSDEYNLYYENMEDTYRENVSSDDVMELERSKQIEIVSGRKYL